MHGVLTQYTQSFRPQQQTWHRNAVPALESEGRRFEVQDDVYQHSELKASPTYMRPHLKIIIVIIVMRIIIIK